MTKNTNFWYIFVRKEFLWVLLWHIRIGVDSQNNPQIFWTILKMHSLPTKLFMPPPVGPECKTLKLKTHKLCFWSWLWQIQNPQRTFHVCDSGESKARSKNVAAYYMDFFSFPPTRRTTDSTRSFTFSVEKNSKILMRINAQPLSDIWKHFAQRNSRGYLECQNFYFCPTPATVCGNLIARDRNKKISDAWHLRAADLFWVSVLER